MPYLQQVIELYNNKIYEALGSDNEIIFNDLKTLRGVLNRINKYKINHDKNYVIYQYNDLISDFYNNRQVFIYGNFNDNELKNKYYEYYRQLKGARHEK